MMWRRMLLVFLFLSAASLAQAANLTLQSMSPQGQVERLTQVVVRFNAPVHALGNMSQDPATSPLVVSLSPDYKTPPPKGSYRWLDESTLAYLFDQPQRQALKLYCRVSAPSLAGHSMAKDVSWVVSTPAIAVLESVPGYNEPLGNKLNIALTFNQPLDLESLKQSATLLLDGKTVLPLNIKEESLPSWVQQSQQLSRVYLFASPGELKVNQRLSLVIKPGLRSQQGHAPLDEKIECHYISYAPLRLDEWSMEASDLDSKLYSPEGGLHLRFNNPVVGAEVKDKLKLELMDKDGKSFLAMEMGDDFSASASQALYLAPKFKPRATYRLTLLAGMKDVYGGILANDRVINFKTGDYNQRLHTATDEVVMESQFAPKQIVWLRNIDSFTVTANYYGKDQAWRIYHWQLKNAYNDSATPPKPGLSRSLKVSAPITRNQPYPYQLDIEKLLDGPKPSTGVVLLTFEYKLQGENKIQRTLLQYSDIGLSLKYGYEDGLVWVTSLKTGQPLANAAVTLWDMKGNRLFSGQSDSQGLLKLPGLNQLKPAKENENSTWGYPPIIVTAEHEGQMAVVTSFARYSLRYAADNYTNYSLNPRDNWNMHAITQLPLYTPGSKVNFVVYVRGYENREMRAVELNNVTVKIYDPTGKEVHSENGSLNAFGSLAGQFTLDEKARLGWYDIRLTWPNEKNGLRQYAAFNVQYYRTPDYQVKVNNNSGQRVDVEADYFFGAPVPGAGVKLIADTARGSFVPARLRDYIVGDYSGFMEEEYEDADSGNDRLPAYRAVLEGHLDAGGRASFNLPVWPEAPGLNRRLTLRAEVTDAAGQVVSGFTSRELHPCQYYVGLKMPYLVEAGKPFEVGLLAVSSDNQPAAGAKVELSLLERTWDVVRERGPEGFYQSVSKPHDKIIATSNLSLNADGGQAKFSAPAAGEYIVRARVVDDKGGWQESNSYVYAYGNGESGWQRFSDNSLQLVAEKDELKVGDVARIMIKNPFARAQALISVEREGISRQWIQELNSSAPVIEVPLAAGDVPNIYVSALVIRGRNGTPAPSGPDLAKPQVRFGNVALKVRDNSGLNVQVTPNATQYKPGAPAQVGVTVKNKDGGSTAPYQLTLLAVDERVLAVAGKENNYDPGASFGQNLPLKVLSEDNRVSIIDQRFSSGLKGEDAAGGGGVASAAALRSKFEPAAYWLAQGVTDEKGQLAVSFNLPDSLTSYRIVAIAADKGKNFGLGESQIKTKLNVQVLSSLPGFVVMGDKFAARFIVQNLSDKTGTAEVKLQTAGITLLEEGAKNIELAAGQMKSVDFLCQAPVAGANQAQFTIEASLSGERDGAKFSLPLVAPSRALAAASAGLAKPGLPSSLTIDLPAGAIKGMSELDIYAASSPASSMAFPIRYLREYPWMCLEQRMSKALGMAFVHSQHALVGVKPNGDELDRIGAILKSVGNFQDNNGQMHFWYENHNSTFFQPYLTAYALISARAIEEMTGLALNSQVQDKAYSFLRQALNNQNAPNNQRRLSQADEAVIIWLLASRGGEHLEAMKGPLNSLLRRLQGQEPYTLACMIMAAKAMGDQKLISDLLVRLDKGKVVTATHTHFATVSSQATRLAMGSGLRDNAAALMAIAQAAPGFAGLEDLVKWLTDNTATHYGLNTQEASYLLMAMRAYLALLSPQDGVRANISLAGKEILRASIAKISDPPLSRSIKGGDITSGELKISAEGGPLYWQSRLRYTVVEANAPAQNAGFSVNRGITGLDGQPVSSVAVGQVVKCTINISVPESRVHVLVFDPFPAGLEPLDATNLEGRALEESDDSTWLWREMRGDGLMLYARELSPGVYTYSYKMRAAVPGTFMCRSAYAEEMYQPETFGYSAPGQLVVQ